MSSKVYTVTVFGGEYEDSWEHIVGVCSSLEVANALKDKIESERNPDNCNISEGTWDSMYDKLMEIEEQSGTCFDSIVDGMVSLFPEYSSEDIERAAALYDNYRDYHGVTVEEIDFYISLSDI